jgi:membrane-bound lytic murein transglycosylase F
MKKLARYIHDLYRRHPRIFCLGMALLAVPLLCGAVEVVMAFETELEEQPTPRSWSDIRRSDTLRVVTVAASTTAFRDKEVWRGHEYEMATQVAKGLDLQLEILLAPDEHSMIDSLRAGRADVAVYPMPSASVERYGGLRPCGYRYTVAQALIGRKLPDFSRYDATLGSEARPTLCVLYGSPQWALLQDPDYDDVIPLDAVNVVVVADSAVQAETMADWVAQGLYDLTLVENNRAQLFHTYHRRLQVGPPIEGSADSVSWVVAEVADTLATVIDSLCAGERSVPQYPSVVKRYYEHAMDHTVGIHYLVGGGHLSVYDSIFYANAPVIPWDWRLLAAVAFVESRFDPYVVSHRGARGLMQLMPGTAAAFGCPEELQSDPVANVEAGARLLHHLRESLRSRLTKSADPSLKDYQKADTTLRHRVDRELDCFVLAGFHAGLGHIYDAITLADSLGYDPLTWHGNVEQCLILKGDSAYFNLPYVRLGRFAGRVTAEYVDEVLETYSEFQESARR